MHSKEKRSLRDKVRHYEEVLKCREDDVVMDKGEEQGQLLHDALSEGEPAALLGRLEEGSLAKAVVDVSRKQAWVYFLTQVGYSRAPGG